MQSFYVWISSKNFPRNFACPYPWESDKQSPLDPLAPGYWTGLSLYADGIRDLQKWVANLQVAWGKNEKTTHPDSLHFDCCPSAHFDNLLTGFIYVVGMRGGSVIAVKDTMLKSLLRNGNERQQGFYILYADPKPFSDQPALVHRE